MLIKQELDTWLDQVSYTELNSPSYSPSTFAVTFMNFIELANGEKGESHKTPPVHLKMLDKLVESNSDYIANLCFRGAGKRRSSWSTSRCFSACAATSPAFARLKG
jgi:hypothetical protein